MIFVQAYFDESLSGKALGRETVPEFAVVAGFANLTEHWLQFSLDWSSVLDAHRPIRYFHSEEANGRRGQFEGFSRQERDAKVIALIDVIRKHRPQPLISAVHPVMYQKLWMNSRESCRPIPIFFVCTIFCLNPMI
jgi:hypothetical protein